MTRSAQKGSQDDGGRGGFRARAIRRLWVATSGTALLMLVALPSGAQDVCSLSGPKLQMTLERSAADIAAFYATGESQLSLNEGGSKGVHQACNWNCSSVRVITPMVNAFGFLKYNCRRTKAPATTRRPTGDKTDSEMGFSITDDAYGKAADAIFRTAATGVGDLMQVPPALENASKSGSVQDLIDAVGKIPGATWLKFSSTSVDNDGEGAARILVRVPDTQDPPRFEQWIQIAIKGSTDKLGRNVDFLARQLVSDATSPINKDSVVVFRGLSRTAKGFVPEGRGSGSELSKCYSCHPSGLRPVVPATAGSIAVGGGRAIKPEGTMLSGTDLASQLTNLKDITSELSRVRAGGIQRFGERSATRAVEPVRPGRIRGRRLRQRRCRRQTQRDRGPHGLRAVPRLVHAGHPERRHEPGDDQAQGREEHGGSDASGRERPGRAHRGRTRDSVQVPAGRVRADPSGMAHRGPPDDPVAFARRARLAPPAGVGTCL